MNEKEHYDYERNTLLKAMGGRVNVFNSVFHRKINKGEYPAYFKKYLPKPKHSRVKNNTNLKDLIMEKYHRQCAKCGSSVGLQVKHIKPLRTHPELDTDPNNLTVLCIKHRKN